MRFALDIESVTLEIGDNGRGFEVPVRLGELVWVGHLGMVGMAERVEALGGRFQVLSAFGKGTTVRVTAPVSWDVEMQSEGGITNGPSN